MSFDVGLLDDPAEFMDWYNAKKDAGEEPMEEISEAITTLIEGSEHVARTALEIRYKLEILNARLGEWVTV